jgi:ABC-type transport system involved in multi-copper enzyme maturation permease subunit
MIKLVWKDLLILKRYLWLAPLYGILAFFVFKTMPGGALSAATLGATYMLMVQASIQDDKNKSEIMLNSLPLRRQDIVFAKYLSVFLYAVLVILSFLLTQGVVTIIGIPISISQISLVKISEALVTMVVLISIYLPIYFKFGYLRSRMVGTILFFACFFFLPIAVAMIMHGLGGVNNPALRNIVVSIQGVIGWLQTQVD